MVTSNDLNAFLALCYLPKPSSEFLRPLTEDLQAFTAEKRSRERVPDSALIREGIKILNTAFEQALSRASSLHVVPLSGGLDSRFILAHLVEAGLREQIVAVTYGTPGSLDFDIAAEVAKYCRVRHETVDLTQRPLAIADLEETARAGAAWTNLISSYYNGSWRALFDNNATYWSGFLGDPLAGSHFRPSYLGMNYQDATRVFVEANRWSRKLVMTEPGFAIERVLPEQPIIENRELLTFPEQLDFSIRQSAWIHKSQVVQLSSVATPFTHPSWIRFMLSLPSAARENCRLYRHMMLTRFPGLFRIRTKSAGGGRLSDPERLRQIRWLASRGIRRAARSLGIRVRVDPFVNYIDFDRAYRDRSDFRLLARSAAASLRDSKLLSWLDPMDIVSRHEAGLADYSRELDTLVSLAISLSIGGGRGSEENRSVSETINACGVAR